MRTMVVLFGVLTLISIPITLTYLKAGGYVNHIEEERLELVTFLPKYTLGNMGYSSKNCEFKSFIASHIHLKCPYGEMTQIVPHGIGINKNGIKVRDGCVEKFEFNNNDCS